MSKDVLELPPPKADRRISYGCGEFQFADLRVPQGHGPFPAAIVIHGGFWRSTYDLEHIGHFCEALRQAGVATWSLEYRRIGNAGGGWQGTFDDVRAGAGFLPQVAAANRLDSKRIVVTGHSAGGQLAAWLASEEPIPLLGAVPLAGVVDLARGYELRLSNGVVGDLLGGSPQQVPDRYRSASPIERLPVRIPVRLIHGITDETVPVEISRRYEASARRAGCDVKLIELPGAGHMEVIDPQAKEFAKVRETILSLLA